MDRITDISQLDPNGTYTYADYLSWRFEERVELIWGKMARLFPAPSVRHQRVSTEVLWKIRTHFAQNRCQVFHAPFDVRLFDKKKSTKANKDIYTVVQPDICVICDPTIIEETAVFGVPDFVIEIIAGKDVKRDTKDKYSVYEEAGVGEYWIVFGEMRFVEVYILVEGKYQRLNAFSEDDVIPVKTLPELSISIDDIFEGV